MLRAMVFTICKCGFIPRCAEEASDSSQNRLDKIMAIIGECGLGIHDLSRTVLDQKTNLPRFNMPFELGLFLGAKAWGVPVHQGKQCLVLDEEPYRYRDYISDIAGQDPRAHHQDPETLVKVIRDWLRSVRPGLMGGSLLWQEYQEFVQTLPTLCSDRNLVPAELTFSDYVEVISGWLKRSEAVSE